MEHGDAWVGVTVPATSGALKKFNPARYSTVSFANPAPTAVGGMSNSVPPKPASFLFLHFVRKRGGLVPPSLGNGMYGWYTTRPLSTRR
jgi:hypothetical protein